MFRWHKEIERLDIPASRVLHLARSLSAVQVALPGLPSQEATAFLCAFVAGKGLRVALVLHLHTSQRLAFYLHARAEAPRQEAGRLIEEGQQFAESMGFMLSDMDFRRVDIKKRDALWNSLPLRAGAEPSAPVAAEASPVAAKEPPVAVIPPPAAKLADVETLVSVPPLPSPAGVAIVEPAEEAPFTPPAPAEALPDVSPGSETTMRARARKQPPSAGELTARRLKLLENLGRFLASL